MKKLIFFKKNNLVLINFDSVFTSIETEYLNELQKYSLIQNYKINLSNKDTKKLFYYFLIHGICEEILHNKHNYKKIIVVQPKLSAIHEIIKFCDEEKLQKFLINFFNKIHKSLPFLIWNSNKFIFNEELHPGELEDIESILSGLYDEFSNKRFTFEKIKKLTTEYELDFLSQTYFNSIETRLFLH